MSNIASDRRLSFVVLHMSSFVCRPKLSSITAGSSQIVGPFQAAELPSPPQLGPAQLGPAGDTVTMTPPLLTLPPLACAPSLLDAPSLGRPLRMRTSNARPSHRGCTREPFLVLQRAPPPDNDEPFRCGTHPRQDEDQKLQQLELQRRRQLGPAADTVTITLSLHPPRPLQVLLLLLKVFCQWMSRPKCSANGCLGLMSAEVLALPWS